MTANCVQASLSQQLAASTTSRRRSVPPSPPEPVFAVADQRWRERPRCPALTVTPGRRDGVVHAIVGRAACRCLRAQFAPHGRAAHVRVLVSRFAEEFGRRVEQKPVRARRMDSWKKRHVVTSRSCRRTIASLMLAPCSASSMLFASLRPGRRPGLRALTTPPRGTSQAVTRCCSVCGSPDLQNVVDARVA